LRRTDVVGMLEGIEPFHDTPADGPRPDRGSTLRSAGIYVVSVFAFAIAFLVVGSLLYDPVPLWVLVVFPLLVFAGAVGALWRTFRMWQAERSAAITPRGRWQVWQGAGWLLLAMFLLSLGGTGGALMDR
jgi:protein-S-isoprenylcysteine O-methyltransferase Ste14